MKVTYIIGIFVLLLSHERALLAQDEPFAQYPQVGKSCPKFNLNEVHYFKKEKVFLEDFKGKWLILDFWTTSCTNCIASFPKLDELQEAFRESIEIVLVGKNDVKWNKDIRSIFEKHRKYYDLDLTVAYDSILFGEFGVFSVPHVIIIDKNGVVYEITEGSELTMENVAQLVNDKRPVMKHKRNKFEINSSQNVNINTPLLINGNGGEDTTFIYRSVLAKWNNQQLQVIPRRIDYKANRGQYQATGLPLRFLYNLAYFSVTDWTFGDSLYNEFHRFPILELNDSSLFQPNFNTGDGVFTYSIIVDKENMSKDYLQEILKRELRNCFGYDAYVEQRTLPYWRLVETKKSGKKLETEGGVTGVTGSGSKVVMKNVSISTLLKYIYAHHGSEPAFVDETGIKKNIDITVDAIMNDLNDVNRALERYGLSLVRGERKMTALIIRESAR